MNININNAKIIKLDIGGTKFFISNKILLKSEYFKAILENNDDEIELFIDRDPSKFEEILKYLNDDSYPINKIYYNELDYYMINYKDLASYKLTYNIDKLYVITGKTKALP